jgi:hypothetical protein
VDLRHSLENLVGQLGTIDKPLPKTTLSLLRKKGSGIGYSQLNELLLLLGFDRVTHAFFQYLVDGTTDYLQHSTISSPTALNAGIDRFRKLGLLFFGNVKFAFKTLSLDGPMLAEYVERLEPVGPNHYNARHDPIHPIDAIPGEKTYYLGYIVARELRERLKSNPNDNVAKAEEKARLDIVEQGTANHIAYLVSDHLDVYVATSMRERHEFIAVSRLTHQIFEQPELKALKLRWFDPTQAFCGDRIDKGLSEALMLRRAQCTIYFAQESDTLGKDSELASTLAQGKTVIAFVPKVGKDYVKRLLIDLKKDAPQLDEQTLILQQLRRFEPEAPWNDPLVRAWINDPASMKLAVAKKRLRDKIALHYDKRADTLKDSHPLGIQVNLETGVANGVLVVRSVKHCAQLVRRIVTRTLEFDIRDGEQAGKGYTALHEKISGCVYRVVTNDVLLTNAFWNFYFNPSE